MLKWMRMLVVHFIAKHVLEVNCRRPHAMQRSVSITVIAMDHPPLPLPSWTSICDAIKLSLAALETQYPDVLNAFKKELFLNSQKDHRDDPGKRVDKVLVFLCKSLVAHEEEENISLDSITFPATFHCEAVLAALGLYPDLVI